MINVEVRSQTEMPRRGQSPKLTFASDCSGTNRGLRPISLPPLPAEPLVSVLITNYNYGPFIEAAVASVLAQSYQHIEVVVCDDASSDDSCSIVEGISQDDSRVRLVRHVANQGQSAALSSAFAASAGEIICMFDSDDTMEPTKVAEVVHCFQSQPDVGLVTHRVMVVDPAGRHVQQVPLVRGLEDGWLAETLLRRGGRWRDTCGIGLSFRREAAELILPVPETGVRLAADSYVFTILPMLTKVAAIDRVLAYWHIHGGNGYGTFRLTTQLIDGDLSYLHGNWHAVNERLGALGLPERQLDLNRHLFFHQRSYEQMLLRGDGRLLIARRLLILAPRLVRDDMEPAISKLVRLITYTAAVPLPMPARRGLLDLVFGKNRLKQSVTRLIGHRKTT